MHDTSTLRTPRAQATVRRAQDAAYRLAADPARCVALCKQRILPAISGATAAAALADFETRIPGEQFRIEFVLSRWARLVYSVWSASSRWPLSSRRWPIDQRRHHPAARL
jgi:hypothetical protein